MDGLEFKGTPGPWRLEEIDSGMSNGMPIGASIYPPLPLTGPEIALVGTSIHDARLIAAAPDLLEALQRLVGPMVTANRVPHEDGCGCPMHEATRAIAKALGQPAL